MNFDFNRMKNERYLYFSVNEKSYVVLLKYNKIISITQNPASSPIDKDEAIILEKRLSGLKIYAEIGDDHIYEATTICDEYNDFIGNDFIEVVARDYLGFVGEHSDTDIDGWRFKYRIKPQYFIEINFSVSQFICSIINNLTPPKESFKDWGGERVEFDDIIFNIFHSSLSLDMACMKWVNRFNNIEDIIILAYCVVHAPEIIRKYSDEVSWRDFITSLTVESLPQIYRYIYFRDESKRLLEDRAGKMITSIKEIDERLIREVKEDFLKLVNSESLKSAVVAAISRFSKDAAEVEGVLDAIRELIVSLIKERDSHHAYEHYIPLTGKYDGPSAERYSVTSINLEDLINFLPRIARLVDNAEEFRLALKIEKEFSGFFSEAEIYSGTHATSYCPDEPDVSFKFVRIYFYSVLRNLLNIFKNNKESVSMVIDSLKPYIQKEKGKLNKGLLESIISQTAREKNIEITSHSLEEVKMKRPTLKVIVLDCDNILWGGIVGEDGAEGIILNESYLEFQDKLLKLKQSGILLAINSKNNFKDVEDVLFKRKEMVLKKDDFVVIKANWEEKVVNMLEISIELNLRLDSFVFFDDSPRERELIMINHPAVLTPDLTDDPREWVTLLDSLFDLSRMITMEDQKRTLLHLSQRDRENLRLIYGSEIEKYYYSLKMKAIIRKGEENLPYIARLEQLSQRTNQFNLTNRRFTAKQIEDLIRYGHDERYENYKVYSLEFIDKFGNNGIVSLLVLKEDFKVEDWYAKVRNQENPIKDWEIIEFCQSCRAINLTLEEILMVYVIDELKKEKAKPVTLKGLYKVTDKNSLVKGLYGKFKFEISSENNEFSIWSVKVDALRLKMPKWIEVLTPNDFRIKQLFDFSLDYHRCDLDKDELALRWFELSKQKGLKEDYLLRSWEVISKNVNNQQTLKKLLQLEIALLGYRVTDEFIGSYDKTHATCDDIDERMSKLRKGGYLILGYRETGRDTVDDIAGGWHRETEVSYEINYALPGEAQRVSYSISLYSYFNSLFENNNNWLDRLFSLVFEYEVPSESYSLYGYVTKTLGRILKKFSSKNDKEWKEYLETNYSKRKQENGDSIDSQGASSPLGDTFPNSSGNGIASDSETVRFRFMEERIKELKEIFSLKFPEGLTEGRKAIWLELLQKSLDTGTTEAMSNYLSAYAGHMFVELFCHELEIKIEDFKRNLQSHGERENEK